MRQITITDEDMMQRLAPIDYIGARCYGIPRGGGHACNYLVNATRVNTPQEADIIVDDIVDSGKTKTFWMGQHPDKKFFAAVDKQGSDRHLEGVWVVFPWEKERGETAPHDAVRRLLQYVGENPDRPGLKGTPDRVCRAMAEMLAGYKEDPAVILERRFACEHRDLVIVRDIHFTSMCEHHLMPFSGKVSIGYIPQDEVVGLSKLPRLVDCFAKRLQLQEQLTHQIATAIQENLKPQGLGVVIEATHGCMSCRGVRRHESSTITSAMTGLLHNNHAARAEFMSLLASRSARL